MTTTYSVQREIDAEPSRVWALLTDAPNYPSWNPTVISVEGTIAANEKIKLTAGISPKRPFKLTVSTFDPNSRMVWSSGAPVVFKGVRTFTLAPTATGGTAFAMEEVFSGLFEPLISKSIPDLTGVFAEFADALKAAAEKS